MWLNNFELSTENNISFFTADSQIFFCDFYLYDFSKNKTSQIAQIYKLV